MHVLSPPSGHRPEAPARNKYQDVLCNSVLPIITDVKEKTGAACFITAVSDSERQSLSGRSDKTGIQRCCASYLKKRSKFITFNVEDKSPNPTML